MKNSAKKYMLLQLYLLLVLPMIGQIAPITLPADGDWPTVVGDSIMLIGPKQEALTEEQRYFNPPYLLVYPGKEHLKEQMIRAALCDCDTNQPNRRIGVFSVAKDKQVSFSQGNLQYLPASNVWKFASQQYEYLHNSNKYISPTYRNWVDLFGWSANNTTAPFGISTSTNNADYAGEFVDWGNNSICGDAPGTWRTMSADEWEFLLEKRKNASNLYGVAKVAGENGLIILPDDWKVPEGIIFKAGLHSSQVNDFSVYQSFTADEWKVMEEAGAVFLHASGYRDGATVEKCDTSGYYWSNTTSNGDDAYRMYFYSYFLGPKDVHSKYRGRSVRLVHDTIVPPPAPCQTFEVKGVTFNMMCVEGDKYDYLIGQTEVTRALWKAVMDNLPTGSNADNDPVDNVTWGDCQEFINQLNSLTGLHFRFPTKEEWLYAAKGGAYNKDFLYSGSDNIDEVGWYDGNTPGGVQPVAQLKPNALGIYDMTGNVWEWVLQTSNNAHLYMGGSYAFNATSCLLGKQGTATAPNHKGSIGLRLVLDKHAYVDLGLSVLWATTNVGAESAEEYGDYFAWGETEPKEVYDWSTYKWFDGTANNLTKYNTTDGLTTLLPEDDAAHVNWGGEWRMAGDAEWTELREQCDWKWTTINGTKGYTVTGPNGNSIFLSAAGFYYASGLSYVNNHGDYWSGTRNPTSASSALHAYFTSDLLIRSSSWRYYGFPVRPVLPTDREILTPSTPGKRIGVFSVAKDKQVSFSQGNLQYIQSANLWRFAENQYDYLGEENIKDGQLANRIDLFGWSGKDSNAPWGISNSTNTADYAGEFVDWGANVIGDDAANTWRTLSREEWDYIVKGRRNAEQLRSKCSIDHVRGLLLLPDDWVSIEGIAIEKVADADTLPSDVNVFTSEQWKQMETAGAVFLPAAGANIQPTIKHTNRFGGYCSSTKKDVNNSYILAFHVGPISYTEYSNNKYGRSVRLVHDTIVPPPAPCQTFEVNGVTFNMMCVEGGTFMMGATENDTDAETDEYPQHQVTVSDFMIGQTEVTQELWTAVMGTNPSKNQGNYLPVEQVTWDECQEFVAKLNQLTGKHFRLPTEAEWEYAARGGNRSRGYKYAGSDNIDDVAWYDGNSGNKTHKVGTKQPNELGIFDMSGNVYEKCQDWYAPYTAEAQVNPQGPAEPQTYRVVRGGCSGSQATNNSERVCRVINRGYARTTSRESITGLRLVLDKHEYVDLGLSVMWATTNVGAESAEEYGDYFAWGETETKDFYGWSTYKWCNGTENTLTKYCTNPKLGVDSFTDGLTTLLPEDDAAHVHWGAMWRMATKSEFQELINNCSWETTTLNGVKGYRVTSTIPGYTDRSIFLPLAGYHNHDLGASNVGTSVRYWSSSGSNTSASDLYMATLEGNTRRIGMSIRPVLPTHRKIITPKAEPNKRIGLFSVGKGKHVTFSQGNLIYLKLKKQWLFAPNQLYYTGNRHLQNGQIADTVMYFGWSAKDNKALWGISTSVSLDYYKGEFLDWGTNTIQGGKPNTWRTMTDEEVVYLFEGRPNAAQLIGFAEVDGTKGMIVLPDDWQLPEGLSFTPYDGTTVNHYTLAQWAQMESAGAVIIPAAGYFNNKLSPKMREVGEVSFLPYSVLIDSIHQQYSYLRHDKILHRWPGNNTGNLYYAFPRRLVHDTVVPEYVDMGLSVKWANYNLGASTPSGVGEYFAWGEIEPKESYTVANYQWANGANALTKYCTVDSLGYNGFTDMLTTLQPQDDAAQMQKGGHWRMPTDAEWEELRRNCTWSKAEQGVQAGYIATSKINGNSIFIPVAGFRSGENVVLEHLGGYWSSSLNESKQSCAYGLYINKDEDKVGKYSNSSRHNGFLIRPVYDENYHAYVDLGLSVYWATTNIGATYPEQYGEYFAWGETEPKDEYTWANYKWCDGTKSTITKYNATDGLTTLLPKDDAAHVNWGGEWRMPTKDELTELRMCCTWEAETINGVKGAKVTGPNGNSIFIPLGGSYNTFDDQLNAVGTHGWLYSSTKSSADALAQEMGISTTGGAQTSCSRCLGLNIRPVVPKPDDGKVTVTINATPSQATIHLYSKGYTAEGNKIMVEKGKDVVYQVTNVANRYLSQGDSLLNLTSDTTLNITLAPFSEGNWVQIDNSTMKCVSNSFVHKNGKVSTETTGWLYYVLPVLPGEEYRISTIAGQDVAAWMAVNTLPNIDSNTPASIISYSPNKGVAVYIAEEMRVPAGATHLIIHARTNKELILEKNVHEYVDLGLSVMWATTNVGANNPEEYGDYFAWGETEPKDKYTSANYKWYDNTKYSYTGGLTAIQLEDDAANVNWGGEWRMPTKEEYNELVEQCTWTWTQYNDVAGYQVIATNGNSIFLPATGYKGNGPEYPAGEYGLYWPKNEIHATNNKFANLLIIAPDKYQIGSTGTRNFGFSVRPVHPIPPPDPCFTFEANGVRFGMMCVEGEKHDYYIGQTEVTQGLWKKIMGYNNSLFQGDELPVEKVSWDECQTFIQKLNALTGLHFRLPTEEEWEYAAKGGKQSRGYTYAGGHTIDSVAWYSGNSQESTHKVASLMPNELGIYDMSGNVWEWCQDYYNANKELRAVRSGSFADAASVCRINARTGRQSDYRSYIGLRLLLDKNYADPDDDKVTVTVYATPGDATVSLLCVGYTREGNSITVDKGKSVLYLVSNVADRYLSQGDSLLNLTRDTTLYVTLEPFSDGVWETVDDSLLEYTPDCYISRNYCSFAQYDSWSYYVMPATEGETYRIQTIAGQHAAPWIAVSTLPDFATMTRASKIACSPIRGVVGYLAEEFTVPAGTKYLIFNHRTSSTYPLKVEKKSKYRYGISSQYWEECNGLWGHGGRGHAVQDQSPIQGTIVQGVRLNLGRVGSLNIYKIPSLFGSTEDNFQLVATITTDSLGLQDIDFPTPIYVGENEYLVFGKPSEITPTLTPMYNTLKYDTFKQFLVHFIGTDKVKKAGTALMVDFY